MTTAIADRNRVTAVERHLREGEARLAQLERAVAELARRDVAAAGLLAERALVPFRSAIAEVRVRAAALRERTPRVPRSTRLAGHPRRADAPPGPNAARGSGQNHRAAPDGSPPP